MTLVLVMDQWISSCLASSKDNRGVIYPSSLHVSLWTLTKSVMSYSNLKGDLKLWVKGLHSWQHSSEMKLHVWDTVNRVEATTTVSGQLVPLLFPMPGEITRLQHNFRKLRREVL